MATVLRQAYCFLSLVFCTFFFYLETVGDGVNGDRIASGIVL